MNPWTGRRVLVIGGSSGIGEAVAQLAAQRGARVTIASRSADKRAAALSRLPVGVLDEGLDASDDTAVQSFFAERAAWDHVVLAGSATQTGPVRGLPLDAARASMDNKFWSAYHVGRHARIADGGSLTFVSGVYAQRPQASAVLQWKRWRAVSHSNSRRPCA
jgi:NAD(P)-dependent dehydrogenase (short-subunit alcohol dehydrogenase family)